jgi:hypothetical protein
MEERPYSAETVRRTHDPYPITHHPFRRLQRPTAGKDRQTAEQPLLLRRQQIVAPGDRRAQGAVTRGRIPGAPISSGSARSRRSRNATSARPRTRAAAISSASGRPSSRRQISTTVSAFDAVRAKSARASRRRSRQEPEQMLL